MYKLAAALLIPVLLASCARGKPSEQSVNSTEDGRPGTVIAAEYKPFGHTVTYQPQAVQIHPDLAQDFSVGEIDTLDDFEKAYQFTLTPAQRAFLEENKFVILPNTVYPEGGSNDRAQEMANLYDAVNGDSDVKKRKLTDAVFYSADVFLNSFGRLYEETLKEMENVHFYPAMKTLSERFYLEADRKAKTASGDDRDAWIKVRNYFAVPYALLSTSKAPLTYEDYQNAGAAQDPDTLRASHAEDDKSADELEKAQAFVRNLDLDTPSRDAVLTDLEKVYRAEDKGLPAIFGEEYRRYAEETDITFEIDFTQFTPRSHYTNSSLRRQYFRAMNWYIQLPFFLKSPELTEYAFSITQLMAENPQQLNDYNKLEAAINFLVGGSDDLMPVDYLAALNNAKGQQDPEKAVMQYLIDARPPRIKAVPVQYSTVGGVESDDVLLLTKGMRFFSGKFIIDSYWTDMLTQGDEAPLAGFSQKLPPMASSLEVMTLLGSDYARSAISQLDFYASHSQAIDQMLGQLESENNALDISYWQSNVYNSWLWTIRGLFDFGQENAAHLPRFMQGRPWQIKTLMTASGFWTQLRHATLLYAKQSFAELGGGGPSCDTRTIPEPPKSYIEPQMDAYSRLHFMAQRMQQGLKEQGYESLNNYQIMDGYAAMMETVIEHTRRQLQNEYMVEKIVEMRYEDPDSPGGVCVHYELEGKSDWEALRQDLQRWINSVIPISPEGPVMSAKDKRAAIVSDVHTGGDSLNPTRILYEGIGVPNLILVAVKDVNGSRYTIGFTYSHYEFTEEYGGPRKTDEEWQKIFYTGNDVYDPYRYTDKKGWPAWNDWYKPLMEVK